MSLSLVSPSYNTASFFSFFYPSLDSVCPRAYECLNGDRRGIKGYHNRFCYILQFSRLNPRIETKHRLVKVGQDRVNTNTSSLGTLLILLKRFHLCVDKNTTGSVVQCWTSAKNKSHLEQHDASTTKRGQNNRKLTRRWTTNIHLATQDYIVWCILAVLWCTRYLIEVFHQCVTKGRGRGGGGRKKESKKQPK